jgi:hypothetical protein
MQAERASRVSSAGIHLPPTATGMATSNTVVSAFHPNPLKEGRSISVAPIPRCTREATAVTVHGLDRQYSEAPSPAVITRKAARNIGPAWKRSRLMA